MESGWARAEIVKGMENKILALDTSGIDPIRFSLKKNEIQINKLQDFFKQASIVAVTSYECVSQEFVYDHNRQQNMFVESLSNSSSTFEKNSIFLNPNGDFYKTSQGHDLQVNINNSQYEEISTINIWKCTSQWSNEMSEEDKSLIKLKEDYKNISYAILTNDYNFRQQCEFEGINVYGTCSMLAGMVLSDTINYQKGTCIFKSWSEKEKKWIPSELKTKRKLSFKEILEIEKNRIKEGRSFWINNKK